MWWKHESDAEATKKAVAYYRHSAQDRQENSIPIQKDQVREFAQEHGIIIIKEFMDQGKSGLSTEGRDGFNQMMEEYVINGKEEFDYILVLDVSRWGRYQDIDLSAYYTGTCQNYGKQVIYTTMGFPKDDDLVHFLHLNIERYRAASYSRELSGKVFKGCVKIAEQGFWAGGMPPYAFNRMLLDENRKPVQILTRGQRKSIQNQRVTLIPGEKEKVATVKRIFREFVKNGHTPSEIAAMLNNEKIPSPAGKLWSSSAIRAVITNELYIGTMIYNKTQQRLKSPTKLNPQEVWIRHENAFKAIIDKDLFLKAQEVLVKQKAEHDKRYSKEDMLARLDRLYKRYGKLGPRQIAATKNMVSSGTYSKRFSSLDMAFQQLYGDVLDRTRSSIIKQFHQQAECVEEFGDYVVLDESFSIKIQPSVPISHGYDAYWAFRPDQRKEVDITLGIPLSNSGRFDILGYFVFPRMMVHSQNLKLFNSSDSKLEFYGYNNLDPIWALLDKE